VQTYFLVETVAHRWRATEKEVAHMALIRFSSDPVEALLALQRELNRAFESPFGSEFGPSGRGVYPPVNVFMDRDGYVLRMEIPSGTPDNVQIETHGRTVVISGKREIQAPQHGSFHRREREGGEFSRMLQLPADVDAGRAQAILKNGILTLRVPKREEAKPRQISVKAG
jgi:HSP20 family protein